MAVLITKDSIDFYYADYLDQKKRSIKNIRRYGVEPRFDVKKTTLSREEFETAFISAVTDEPKTSGKRIAEKMAKQEVYYLSGKAAMVRAEAFEKLTGVRPNLMDFLTGQEAEDLYDAIKARREELFGKGKSKEQVRLDIAQEFFGSK